MLLKVCKGNKNLENTRLVCYKLMEHATNFMCQGHRNEVNPVHTKTHSYAMTMM